MMEPKFKMAESLKLSCETVERVETIVGPRCQNDIEWRVQQILRLHARHFLECRFSGVLVEDFPVERLGLEPDSGREHVQVILGETSKHGLLELFDRGFDGDSVDQTLLKCICCFLAVIFCVGNDCFAHLGEGFLEFNVRHSFDWGKQAVFGSTLNQVIFCEDFVKK